MFFFLLFITSVRANDIYLSCESTTKLKTSFIINDAQKKLILDGVEREIVD